MPLFVVLRDGAELDESLEDEISQRIRNELSPKMVPDDIFSVSEDSRGR